MFFVQRFELAWPSQGQFRTPIVCPLLNHAFAQQSLHHIDHPSRLEDRLAQVRLHHLNKAYSIQTHMSLVT